MSRRGNPKDDLRRTMKAVAANALHYTGLRKAMKEFSRHQAGGRRILIVSYHRVVDDFTGELQRSIPGLLISKETFRKHLESANHAGYEFASMTDALAVMSGRKVAKKDLCVVTFDDGYRDVYRHAFPILKEMGVPGMMYLPAYYVGTKRRFNHDRLFHLIGLVRSRGFRPIYDAMLAPAAALLAPILSNTLTLSAALDDFIGEHRTGVLEEVIEALEKQLGGGSELLPEQGDVMDWDEVRTMAKSGIEFGAHTLDHSVLTLEDRTSVDRQLGESKRIIEESLGSPVRDFAYCNGWYSDQVVEALVANGFRSAVTTEDYPNRIGGDPFTLKRKVLWENFSLGVDGAYSECLTGCQLDDLFGMLGMNHPVPGRQLQRNWEAR
ncbi:MAG: polysaccharide deacetylase family protein [Myxococcaceae bacterium]